jgi:hypothetical protein
MIGSYIDEEKQRDVILTNAHTFKCIRWWFACLINFDVYCTYKHTVIVELTVILPSHEAFCIVFRHPFDITKYLPGCDFVQSGIASVM